MKTILRDSWISLLISLVVLIFGIIYFPKLPEQVAIHFNGQGNPDRFTGRVPAVVVLPMIAMVTAVLLPFLMSISPKGYRMEHSHGPLAKISVAFSLLLNGIEVGILLTHLYPHSFSMQKMLAGSLALFMVAVGNYLGQIERNFFLGIKTPWAIASDENWTATHRFASKLMMGLGLLIVPCSLLGAKLIVALVLLVIGTFLPVAYSYWYFVNKEKGINRP